MVKKSILFFLSLFVLCSTLATAESIRICYKCIEKNPAVQQIKFNFRILNDSGAPAQLSDLKIRYYYSKESFVSREEFHVEYAAIGSSNVVGQFYPGFVEITFKEDAGVIPNAGDSGEIQIRLNMVDWMVYDQSNDFSFDPTKTEYADTNRMALFWKGSRVWGSEGVGEQPPSSLLPSPSP